MWYKSIKNWKGKLMGINEEEAKDYR